MAKLLVILLLLRDANPCLTAAQAGIESGYRADVYRKHPRKQVFFCGLWQTMAKTKEDCNRVRFSVSYALEARTREWAEWMKACKNNVACALGGYGCGWFGAKNPRECGVRKGRSYPTRVLELSKTCNVNGG